MSHLMTRLKHEKHLLAKGIRLLLAQNSQRPQEGPQLRGPVSPSQYHNLGTRNQNVNAGTKLLDEAKTRGLLPVPWEGPHLQGQSLGSQSLQNTVPASNEVIHAMVNVLEGGVKLQGFVHWYGGGRVL